MEAPRQTGGVGERASVSEVSVCDDGGTRAQAASSQPIIKTLDVPTIMRLDLQ